MLPSAGVRSPTLEAHLRRGDASMGEVQVMEDWLAERGLQRYADIFWENEIFRLHDLVKGEVWSSIKVQVMPPGNDGFR